MDESVQTPQIPQRSMEENINIIKANLYAPILTPELESLIIAYIDAYHTTLDYCLTSPIVDEEKNKELEILSGPINEIYNPNNEKMFDGNSYPAVELILSKINEYASGLEKGFARTLKTPNSGAALTNDNNDFNSLGYLSIFFIFTFAIIFSIGLGYLLFILKK